MNRRLLLLITSPALLFGLVLILACTAGMFAIHSLQRHLLESIDSEVASLRAGHEMEVALHKVRFDSLLSLINPTPDQKRPVLADYADFEQSLRKAKQLATEEQAHLIREIEEHYRQYQTDLGKPAKIPSNPRKEQLLAWIDAHPIQQAVDPCQRLLESNQKTVEHVFHETENAIQRILLFFLVLGCVGSLGGVLAGSAIARTLSRSIARLQVRVQDVHSQVAPEVGVVDLTTNRGLDDLNDQMQVVIERVQSLVERLQSHQRELIRAEQLANIGRLASSIAHELRNPLTAMQWLVDAAINCFPDEPMRLQDLQVLQGEIDRMRQTVQQTLDFVRPPTPRRCQGDLRDIVHQSLELIRARKRQLGITCELDVPSQPVGASFDAAQMRSVVLNLLLNALDAMPHGGALKISLSTNGTQHCLTVEDTGAGISPQIKEQLFTPFVSTKPTGTGLGLSVSKRFVQDHGGELYGENRDGGGARFVVLLPIQTQEVSCLLPAC